MLKNIGKWQVEKSELVLDEPWARVRHDVCVRPDGSTIDDYYYWEGGDFALVFALTPEGQVILTRQYKHGVKDIVLELPAGMVEATAAETPLETARRELLEETGYIAGEWQALGALHVSSAKSDVRAHAFLALGARPVQVPQFDRNEDIEVELCTVPEFVNWATNGVVKDSSSLATALLALSAIGHL